MCIYKGMLLGLGTEYEYVLGSESREYACKNVEERKRKEVRNIL